MPPVSLSIFRLKRNYELLIYKLWSVMLSCVSGLLCAFHNACVNILTFEYVTANRLREQATWSDKWLSTRNNLLTQILLQLKCRCPLSQSVCRGAFLSGQEHGSIKGLDTLDLTSWSVCWSHLCLYIPYIHSLLLSWCLDKAMQKDKNNCLEPSYRSLLRGWTFTGRLKIKTFPECHKLNFMSHYSHKLSNVVYQANYIRLTCRRTYLQL